MNKQFLYLGHTFNISVILNYDDSHPDKHIIRICEIFNSPYHSEEKFALTSELEATIKQMELNAINYVNNLLLDKKTVEETILLNMGFK